MKGNVNEKKEREGMRGRGSEEAREENRNN